MTLNEKKMWEKTLELFMFWFARVKGETKVKKKSLSLKTNRNDKLNWKLEA